jgi:dynein light chain Tctex-type 1
MHSAVGAYWNNEKDGTYSYKWEGAIKKGMDIVIAITWVAL